MAQNLCNWFNLVNIDFNTRKGLILKWNFTGQLSKNIFYRHLILIDSQNSIRNNKFMKLYQEKIKIGDLYTIFKKKNQQSSISLKWKQKSLMNEVEFDIKTGKQMDFQQFYQILQEIYQNIKQSQGRQPLILSILTQKSQSQLQLLQKNIKNSYLNNFPLTINIFGNLRTKINFNTGINYFEFKQSNQQQILKFYKKYLNKIQLFNVQIAIECENGSLNSQNSQQWTNTDFNRIVKNVHAPHMNYDTDTLLLLNNQINQPLDMVLNITLKYQNLQRKKFKSNKRISLTYFTDSIHLRTLGQKNQAYMETIYDGILFENHPFKTEVLIWFKKQRQIQKQREHIN